MPVVLGAEEEEDREETETEEETDIFLYFSSLCFNFLFSFSSSLIFFSYALRRSVDFSGLWSLCVKDEDESNETFWMMCS